MPDKTERELEHVLQDAIPFAIGGLLMTGALAGRHQRIVELQQKRLIESSMAVNLSVEAVNAATAQVQAALLEMNEETTRIQKLAIWVGVGTALVGALLGGVVGAVAANYFAGSA